jgi:SSS family solute:Na+ symporter
MQFGFKPAGFETAVAILPEGSMGYLIVIFGYLLVLIVVGLVITKRSVKNSDDFVVAGRRLPLVVLIGTLLATWCGGGGITGSANFIYTYGPFAGIIHFLGPPIGIIILYWVSGRVRQTTTYTIPELFETKYGSGARILSSICIILAYAGIVSSQFMAAGRIIAMSAGINQTLATVLSAVGIIIITVSGGMVTVAYTDAVGAFIMVVGFLIAVPLLMGQIDLPGGIIANLPDTKNSFTAGLSGVQLLGYMLPSLFLILGDQNLMQRFGAARDSREARKSNIGMFIAEIAVIVTTILIVTAGIFLIPSTAAPDTIIFQLALGYLPFVFGAILMAACVTFVITTGDSFLLSAATNLTYDIWAQFIKKDATDKEKLRFIRGVIVVLGVVSFVMGMYFPNILSIQMYSYTMYGAAITPALLCALFYKGVTKVGGLAGIVTGAVITILWDAILKSPMGIRSALISVPLSFIVIFAVSLLTPKAGKAAV